MTTHNTRMREARRLRKLNGIDTRFGIQTDLRNELSEVTRMLRDLDGYQISPVTLHDIKIILQQDAAGVGEELFRSMNPDN